MKDPDTKNTYCAISFLCLQKTDLSLKQMNSWGWNSNASDLSLGTRSRGLTGCVPSLESRCFRSSHLIKEALSFSLKCKQLIFVIQQLRFK